MSLNCHETGHGLRYGVPFYISTRQEWSGYDSLSREAIDKIPLQLRRLVPCSSDEPGLDIHLGVDNFGRPNLFGNYQVFDWEPGEFLFSVSGETAEKYLPKSYKYLVESIKRLNSVV